MDRLYCLKWDKFCTNASKLWSNHREISDFCDITLVTDDFQKISAHKLVLSSSSEYFRKDLIMEESDDKNLILCINDISHEELSLMMDFIYKGEVKVKHNNIERFMELAKRFMLDGLMSQEPPKENLKKSEEDKHKASQKTKDCEIKPKTEPVLTSDINYSEIEPKTQITELALTKDEEYVSNQISTDNYSQVRALSDQYIETLEDGTFSCSMCGMSGKLKHVIQYHVETHLDGLSFPCPVCDKTYKTRNSQRVHLSLKHRGVVNLKLKQHNMQNYDESYLDILSFPCSVCDKNFKTKNSQRVHISLNHRRVANLKQLDSNIVENVLDNA